MDTAQIIALIIGIPICWFVAHLALLDHEIRYHKIIKRGKH